MNTDQKPHAVLRMCALAALVPLLAGTSLGKHDSHDEGKPAKTLYVWTGDQARVASDFLAVIDFDEDSPRYGKVIRTVPVPGPGGAGNEPHHCHLSADKNILACGGLLALLRGQDRTASFSSTCQTPAGRDSCSRRAARSRTSRMISCHCTTAGSSSRRWARTPAERPVVWPSSTGTCGSSVSGPGIPRGTISTRMASRPGRIST